MHQLSRFGALLGLLASASLSCQQQDDGKRRAYGTIEATQVRVASWVGGRVTEVRVREGEQVQSGQVLLHTDTAELELQLAQAQAGLKAANAAVHIVQKGTRSEDMTSARKSLRLADLQVESAQRDYDRMEKLSQRGAVTSKQVDDARAGLDMSVARREQAQSFVDKLRRGARNEEIESAQAARDQAEAQVALVNKRIADADVVSPLAARVLYRLIEPGEIARPGTPLLVLADLDHVYVDAYVGERDIGQVQLHGEVDIEVDAFIGKTFKGRVAHINDEAEFTPKNVQTDDQRALLVYAIRVDINNDQHMFKPGMPATVVYAAPHSVQAQP